MAGDFITEKLCIFLLHTKSVVFLVRIILFQLDHQINRVRLFNALHTEQRLNIDDADTAQLDKMTRDIRRSSDQRDVTHTADFHNVITDQTMSALDELQRRLAFTDSALAHDQNTFAVYVNQNAVYRDTRRQLNVQPSCDFCRERRGLAFRCKCRHLIFSGKFQQLFSGLNLCRKDHAGNIA